MMVVDDFKLFNDTYGHLAGDRVLESLTQRVKQNFGSENLPSRFRSSEFAVLLPGADADTAFQAAEQFRLALAGMEVPWDTPLPPVTISLIAVTFDDKGGDVPADTILEQAHAALYQLRGTGRNRTTIWRVNK
jgi:diguanylate cyclase (GGDEF)-like protein